MPYLPHVRPDHDEVLIARLAVGDLDPGEAMAAQALVADCPACAELLTDLTLIASATAALPAVTRSRDFRLTDADAARLRPAGWRGLVARFGSPGLAFTRPLAGGLAALGIAGLILASIPAGLGGAASSAALTAGPAFDTTGGPVEAAGQAGGQGAKAAASAAASAAPVAAASSAASSAALAPAGPETATDAGSQASNPPPAVGGAPATDHGSVSAVPGAVRGAASANTAPTGAGSLATGRDAAASTFGSGPTPLVVLSLTLLVVGLVLGGLRLLADRLV